MLKIPKTELIPCQDDDDYVLVMQDAVTHVVLPTLDEGAEELAATSSSGTAAAADASVTPKAKIVSRPQAGHGQQYYSMLHRWAGRSAGGFGRPAGYQGNGKWAKHAHRFIPSVKDQFPGLQVDESHQVQLFEAWLKERNLMGYVTKVEDAPPYPSLSQVVRPKSVYYQVLISSEISDTNGWQNNWHGTYIYTLWDIVANGLQCSGIPGEGGDNHVKGEQLVYTTPNPELAYSYACPHQMFGNGFLFKVVLDVRVQSKCMVKQFNRLRYNWETLYKPEHTKIAGFWLFVDAHAEQSDSRILEWDPEMETIPQFVVDHYLTEGHDHERTMPHVITDHNPMFEPLCHASWTDRNRLGV